MLETILELDRVFEKEPSVIKDNSKNLLFVGDIHGDLETVNLVQEKMNNYDKVICLGDYVDRGKQDIKVVKKISNLKINNQDKITLLPGNHDAFPSILSDFQNRLIENTNQGIKISLAYRNAFRNAPIAYHNTSQKVLAIHGFIPREVGQNIKNWKKVKKGPKYNFQILWNDPMLSFEKSNEYNPRGEGINWIGREETYQFMRNNDLNIIIRGHEAGLNEIRKVYDRKVVTVDSCSLQGERKFYTLPKDKLINKP